MLGGSPGGYDGQVYRTGMVPLDSPPVRAGLPVYLAALSPRMLALAGRIADGVILNLMTPAQAGSRLVSSARPRGRPGGIRRRSRSSAWCTARCPMTGFAAAAAARAVVLRYVLHPSVPRLFGELDGGPGLGGVRRAGCWLAIGRGPSGGCRSRWPTGSWPTATSRGAPGRIAEYRAAGVDLPVLFPVPIGGDWGYEKVITGLGAPRRRDAGWRRGP